MNKIIFIDDEQEVLQHYLNALPKTGKNENDALKSMAANLFDFKSPTTHIDGDLEDVKAYSASQGLDAIGIIKGQMETDSPIQVAFIDMRMPPGMDGKETAKRIRQMDPRVEIVIVTAYSDSKPEALLSEIGIPEKLLYLKKPFDLSEIRQLIRNLTSKYQSERIKDEFISNVTHELKTPLASILGFSELLLPELVPSSSMHEYATILHSNALLMKCLISDLLETTRASKGEMSLHKEKVDLRQIVQEVHKSFKVQNTKKELEINMELTESNPIVEVDPVRFKQVLFNIMGNALKFTEQGEVKIKIQNDNGISLCVADTGEGMDEEVLEKIFDKFYRVENSHHQKNGMGLGLFIVKRILEQHELKYNVASKKGSGTEFSIYFPKGA